MCPFCLLWPWTSICLFTAIASCNLQDFFWERRTHHPCKIALQLPSQKICTLLQVYRTIVRGYRWPGCHV